MPFNQRLYEVSLETLLTANVPKDIAEAASRVVASDDPNQPDLGRTPQDTAVAHEAVKHYWRGQADG
ncbi:hypothetical protein I8748_05615 [Nostoc sp. CENA67]|uniref:Uncharacterized protein n=1 Tax=Amazonocrinis nigriterrae CENA67 TaxID=2794033 RepID=A0A8J7L846_9NOST|nr:hypothetical protein [Amazonocrinis nigriterrae]MBH8561661.1 hypothetical protein [Amazonocrinis nigriterrae CENA67]